MNVNAVLGTKRTYGVHEWVDQHGNHGTEILTQRHIKVYTARANGLFDLGHEKTGIGLTEYFDPGGNSKRNILVVVDSLLPESRRIQIEAYFVWCKMEKLLQDYTIMALAVHQTEKTLQKVLTVVKAAKQFGLKRRDLFVAIGSTMVTDIVGFAAATYRRSTPWILVPTDIVGIIRCSVYDNKLSLNHMSHDGTISRATFALSHPPIASFYDRSFLGSLHKDNMRRGLAEIVKMSVHKDGELFLYVEAHLEKMFAGTQEAACLITAVELAARAAVKELGEVSYGNDTHLSTVKFGDEAVQAIEKIKGSTYDDADSVAIGVALTSALLFLNGNLCSADLGRVLNLLDKAGLPIYDETLEANGLWEHMMDAIREQSGASVFIVPMALGKGGCVNVTDLSLEDIGAALSVLRKRCSEIPGGSPVSGIMTSNVDVTDIGDGFRESFHEQTASEDVQYHVVSVPEIFSTSNTTLVQDYCVDKTSRRKRKVLVIVDDHLGSTVADIDGYFKRHSYAIDEFCILSMHVSSKCKDIDSMLGVADAAIGLRMSQRDILVVVGGGTLMDIVGFAAAIFKGGIPYVRIPTTLVGMIDAGVGAKVGVNFGNHKSLIGRYFPPIACLNDPETFLVALPRREFACGLAEASKMAILKSPRLFEVIEKYHRNVEYNTYTHELIYISIRTMLEELQPNLHEHNLRRGVDFGHEFGHIVESLAGYEIPHGECVAIGMAISSFLAHLKGTLSRSDLERILNCILDMGLPIYVTDYDCCNADILWAKIRTEGIEHKDGMLWLAVPETIGRGSFLDNISDIDAGMVSEAVLSLRWYADRYRGGSALRTIGLTETSHSALRDVSVFETGKPSLPNGNPSLPNGDPSLPNGNSSLPNGTPSLPNGEKHLCTTAAIIGASGDIGSQLAGYLVHNDVRVICSVRPASLHSFKKRIHHIDPKMRILTGGLLDLANLRVIIQEADVFYNMAGFVTLSSKPGEFARVIALNGFAQGIITHLIQQMGRDRDVKVIYPSSQRVHLTSANASVDAWVQNAARAYSARQDGLFAEPDIYTALEQFAEQLIASHPLPAGFNVYDISKRLGEHFVSLLPRHLSVRISGVYGPSFTRGFVYRAVNPKAEGNVEASEIRDFIYIDDLNESLLKAAQTQPADSDVFDGASGESTDLQEVWRMVREETDDRATVVFKDHVAQEVVNLDPTFARHLLGRDFTPIRLGLRKTIGGSVRPSHQSEPIVCLQHSETFKHTENEDLIPGTTLLKFVRSGDGFRIYAGVCPITGNLERSLNQWFNKLPTSHQEVLTEYVNLTKGLSIRLRSDPAMTQISEFTIEQDGQHSCQGFIDIHAGLATRACHPDNSGKIDDIVGHEGYHLLAFLLRGRRPLLSERERGRERAMAEKWKDFLRRWDKPHVIVLDVGATYLRVGIMGPHGLLLHEPARIPSPSKQSYPQDTLAMLQERLIETLVCEINIVRASHSDLSFEEVGISFGAVVTREGVVKDASILWNDSARGYDFKNALLERLPGVRLTILNDISAAAWRYKDEGRFCLVTVSSGLSNKVFNPDLRVLDQLDLDAAGVGGEMGHVIVEPRAVDALVQHAILQATADPEELGRSQLNTYVHGDAQKINATYLGMAVKEGDEFAVRLLEEADVPYCPCGNLADLCSYSSGRGALRHAQSLAARGNHGIASNDISDNWLQQAIATGHPLALKVLYDSTYPLALRILQLAADIGLDKFIIVGGFAMKTGKRAYLKALQDHLVRFGHHSAFYSDWDEDKVRGLVKFGVDDDNDGLMGMGRFVQHLRAHYHAVEKAVGEQSLAVVTRSIPRCGAQEVLAKVVFSGICTTDLQILRGERGLEPTVLGHEGVCQVLEVGKDVRGLNVGEMIILNPNNPLDDHDKLGHTREGVFQEYVKFGQEFLERRQVLNLGRSAVSATDTLVEPLSCVVAAQDRIKDRIAGRNVLVIGAGLMGLLFVSMNVKMGARNVFLANRSKERLDFAVARGIIQEKKVFVIGEYLSSQVDEVSAGEGADIVIICVSLGQGVRAAQDAITYVNAGGCVYLFAGFRPGDVLALDGGAKADAWSIRSAWKTKRIQIAGKPVDLSGHRGSRNEDLAMAANIIRHDNLSFGRVISHIVSLDVLPDIMLALARDGNIQGVPAKRVVVDMATRDRVVECAEELPLRHLHEAARKQKDAVPMGNLFREIGFEGNNSLLGWAYPPAWQDIKVTVETALQMNSLSSKRHFIWVGTGGWVFLVDALTETIPASQDITFHTLQSLEPQALADLFALIEDLSVAVCLGMSQSGKTLETVMLMNALRERFDSAGLDYREHFVWLTDMCKSVHDCKSGEAAIRVLKKHDWKNVDMVPLTVGNHSDINALFCAPHSVLMFLPLVLLLRKDSKAMRHVYQQYLALRDGIVHGILPKAYSVASNHIEHIQVSLDESIAPAMIRLVTQLIEQGLGSKQVGFNPRVRVASCGKVTGFELVALPMPTETPAVVKVMLTMNTLSAFVAMVAYHRRIEFITHPKVDLYKHRAVELMATAEVEQKVSDPEHISAEVIAYLSKNPRTPIVEVLCYGHVPVFHRQSIKDWLTSCLASGTRSISIDVFPGEEWNHSRYQAAVQTEDIVYVILVLQKYCFRVEGISKGAIYGNTRTLEAIARATYDTLLPKALYFQIGEGFPKDKVSLSAT